MAMERVVTDSLAPTADKDDTPERDVVKKPLSPKGDKEVDLAVVKDGKEEKKEEEIPNMGGCSAINKEFGRKYWFITVMAFLASLAFGATLPLFGLLFKEMMDALIYADNKTKEAKQVIYYFFIVGAGSLVVGIMQYYFWGKYGLKVGMEIRKQYFDILLRQDVSYHDEKNSGVLNTGLVSDSYAIDNAIGPKKGFYWQQLAQFVTGIALAFVYSWQMTLVLIATMPVIVVVGVIQGRLMMGTGGQAADPFTEAGGFSYEVLLNIRTVVAYPKLVSSKINEFADIVAKAYPIVKKRAMILGGGLGFVMFGSFAVMYGIGLWYGMVLIKRGTIDISEMFGCYFSFLMGGMALGQLGSVAEDMKNGEKGANNFLYIRSRVPDIRQSEVSPPISNKDGVRGDIEFENVTFAYKTAEEKTVLHELSFAVKSGQTFAIVGPSGSGKSTVISLLERYYDPQKGNIRIDGELIHNYDVKFLREQIGYVSQMPLLFDTSIKENVRAGNPYITDEDIYEACKKADAHEFIVNLPDQYETKVGEMGGKLSGGQKQRISIARAIAGKPSILLLDEATSALDTKSEKEVQAALDKIAASHSQTIIVIAHRLSTIKNSDQILVLVEGELDEIGTHDELMEMDGMYATLIRSQDLVAAKEEAHQIDN